MRSVTTLLLFCLLVAQASAQPTPLEGYLAFREALRTAETMAELEPYMSSGFLANSRREEAKWTPEQRAKALSQFQGREPTSFEVTHQYRIGSWATIYGGGPDREGETWSGSVDLRLEDGLWKVHNASWGSGEPDIPLPPSQASEYQAEGPEHLAISELVVRMRRVTPLKESTEFMKVRSDGLVLTTLLGTIHPQGWIYPDGRWVLGFDPRFQFTFHLRPDGSILEGERDLNLRVTEDGKVLKDGRPAVGFYGRALLNLGDQDYLSDKSLVLGDVVDEHRLLVSLDKEGSERLAGYLLANFLFSR